MSDVRITPQDGSKLGITPSYTGSLSASNTYQVRNTGHTILHFKETEATACTVTVQTPGTVGGLAIAENEVTVAASSGDVMIGPLSKGLFDDSDGDIEFTLSNIDGLTVAAVNF